MQHYTLCILLIENSVGMHRVVPGCKVLQVDYDNIINLCSQYGPQEAQPAGSGSLLTVSGICELSEHSLLINTTNTVGSTFKEYSSMSEIQMDERKKSV